MSIVDRLPELTERLPEEIKRLRHHMEVVGNTRISLWEALSISLEEVAQSLPVGKILLELIDGQELERELDGQRAEIISEVVGDLKNHPAPTYCWYTEWKNQNGVQCGLEVLLSLDGALKISGMNLNIVRPNTHTWKRTISSSQHELEEAIGYAYLEIADYKPENVQ